MCVYCLICTQSVLRFAVDVLLIICVRSYFFDPVLSPPRLVADRRCFISVKMQGRDALCEVPTGGVADAKRAPSGPSVRVCDADKIRDEGIELYNSDPHLIEVILDQNGWSKDDFLLRRQEFTGMELFLLNLAPNVPVIQYFHNLTTVKMMHVGLTDMCHLDKLPCLEKLWLSENNLSKIEHLENCAALKELYLHNNHIRVIEGLDANTNLEVLWIARNNVEVISGLDNLRKLRVLWLGANAISTMKGCFNNNPMLENLNVSGNHFESFREIPPLSKLHNLKRLYFSDPTYGTNPVCALCNYQTFTLYHLSQIQFLDYVAISEDQRRIAETTFLKKKVYYNMRMKTLQRNARSLLKKARQFYLSKEGELFAAKNVVVRALRNLQAELDLLSVFEDNKEKVAPLQESIASAQRLIEQRNNELQTLSSRSDVLESWICQSVNSNISRLMIELDTGGNVRIEEGKPQDVWYQSCVELVRTRMFLSDHEKQGIKDLRVTKVSRLHNRARRSRFDAALDAAVDLSDPSYRRALEYLFLADTTLTEQQMNGVVEDGLCSDQFPGGGIPLTNSMFLADQQRIRQAVQDGHLARYTANTHGALTGRIVVVKVFLGKCAAEGAANLGEVVAGPPSVDRAKYAPSTSSVYRAKPSDPKQRVWFCFESNFVLPEYIVEFSYVSSNSLIPLPPQLEWGDQRSEEMDEVLRKLFPMSTRVDMTDFRSFAHHFLSFVSWCNILSSKTASESTADVLQGPAAAQPAFAWESGTAESNLASYFQQKSGKPVDLAKLAALTVVGAGLKDVKKVCSPTAINIKKLVLSFNEIAALPPDFASSLPLLEHLDLGNNLLKRIEPFTDRLPQLVSLKIGHNLLYRAQDAFALFTLAPALQELEAAGNPLTEQKNWRLPFVEALPRLVSIDGVEVESERQLIAEVPKKITIDLIAAEGKSSICAEDDNEDQMEHTRNELSMVPPPEKLEELPVQLLNEIVVLRLTNMRIQKMECLEPLVNLRVLSLAGNHISSIECLDALRTLEALDLGDNGLCSMDGVDSLIQLRRLELRRNCIKEIAHVEKLLNLAFFSIEDNAVESMVPLAELPSLTEVYLAGNRVTNGKEVSALRDLPRLIILDLSGNPCVGEEGYRLHTIFQLKKLKVLDGVSIDSTESAVAKDTFAGRISTELLNERVGGDIPWGSAKELSLASCALKEVTLMNAFVSLQHLTLDHNALVDITGLRSCTALLSLNLSFNRLGNCAAVGATLQEMPVLESISLECNGISSIQSLQLRLPRLKFLNLKNNEVLKVDGLDELPQLREIILAKNRLRVIEHDNFMCNPYLRDLCLDENSIKTIEGVRILAHLQKLSVASNRIAEISDIEKGLEGLSQIIDVSFIGNPVGRKPLYRTHTLHLAPNCVMLDGRQVSTEERERAEQFFEQEAIPPNVFTDVRSPMVGTGPIVVSLPQPPAKAAIRIMTLDTIHDAACANSGGVGAAVPRGRPSAGQRQPVGGRTNSADHILARPRGKMPPPAPSVPQRKQPGR